MVASDEHSEALSRANALDGAWYLQACQPRLSGAVAFAEPGAGPNNLDAVVRRMGGGATIVLLPGVHEFQGGRRGGAPPVLEDVWLVGMGTGTTTVKRGRSPTSGCWEGSGAAAMVGSVLVPATATTRDGPTTTLQHGPVRNLNALAFRPGRSPPGVVEPSGVESRVLDRLGRGREEVPFVGEAGIDTELGEDALVLALHPGQQHRGAAALQASDDVREDARSRGIDRRHPGHPQHHDPDVGLEHASIARQGTLCLVSG